MSVSCGGVVGAVGWAVPLKILRVPRGPWAQLAQLGSEEERRAQRAHSDGLVRERPWMAARTFP